MLQTALLKLSARLPCRLIKVNGEPYLERYYVGRLLGVTFYLHRFVSPDGERHLHNHPWGWSRSLVLSGGYTEEVVVDLTTASPSGCLTELRHVRWWNRVDGNHFHRIAAVGAGTWTLFFHGARQYVGGEPKGWGFLTPVEGGVMFAPYQSAAGDWWKTAPRGCDAGRAPL